MAQRFRRRGRAIKIITIWRVCKIFLKTWISMHSLQAPGGTSGSFVTCDCQLCFQHFFLIFPSFLNIFKIWHIIYNQHVTQPPDNPVSPTFPLSRLCGLSTCALLNWKCVCFAYFSLFMSSDVPEFHCRIQDNCKLEIKAQRGGINTRSDSRWEKLCI